MADHPNFTVIECAYQRQFGPEQYSYFVKIDGRWIVVGFEDVDDGSWEEVTEGYNSVRVVAGPT